jgi:hypothetical protein
MHFLDLLAYIALGILAGTASGLLGIGGNIILVPSLILIFGLHHFPPELIQKRASGTALSVSIFTILFSLRAHIKLGTNVWQVVKLMLPGIVIGAISGALLAHFLHPTILRIILAVFLSLIALTILFGFEPNRERSLPNKIGLVVISYVIGSISSMLGLAGGTIIIPSLLWCNLEIRRAIPISLACSFIITTIGTAVFVAASYNITTLPKYSLGYIYLPALISMVIVLPVFTTLGAKLSHKLSTKVLQKIFAALLLAISIKMLLG